MQIRDATGADWPSIYSFWSSIVAEGETYAYPEGLSSDEAAALWMGQHHVVVATVGAAVAGSATMGPNRPGRGSHISTASVMVDSAYAGRGIGRALGEELLRWSRAEGYRGIQFNAVVETNSGAVHLWQSLGFEILATVPAAFAHPRLGDVGLHVMFRPLA